MAIKNMYMRAFALFILLMVIGTTACMENYNDRYFIKDHFVEFEEATTKGKALGEDYVIATQMVKPDESVRLQVNLVGAPLETDQVIHFRVVAEKTTAVAGSDYTLSEASALTIPAQSNFGYIEVMPTSTGGGETLLVIELQGNDLIKVSENYKQLAIRCIYP